MMQVFSEALFEENYKMSDAIRDIEKAFSHLEGITVRGACWISSK